jgi:hypothetical protein
MWLTFDLTHGELVRLCRKAGKPEYANHIRSYYDSLRKQLFEKLDWFTEKFLASDIAKNTNTGWLKSIPSNADGTPGTSSIPRYPKSPDDKQLREARFLKVKWLKQAWANVDIFTKEAWEDKTSNVVLLAACRTATYVKYRAASLQEPKK